MDSMNPIVGPMGTSAAAHTLQHVFTGLNDRRADHGLAIGGGRRKRRRRKGKCLNRLANSWDG